MCSPRPFIPPVTRISEYIACTVSHCTKYVLAISTHHLEYGFPSTHATNSVSIALFFFMIIHRLYKTPAAILSSPISPSDSLTLNPTYAVENYLPQTMVSKTTYIVSIIVLAVYCFSIVYGRLYTGMHSFTDCAFGVFLGAAIWGLYALIEDLLDQWLRTAGWIGE